MRLLLSIGYDSESLRWLSDYLTNREQYVVIEATDGAKYAMPVGTPQGGALGPSMWREFTNELPESINGEHGDSCRDKPPLCDSQEWPPPELTEIIIII